VTKVLKFALLGVAAAVPAALVAQPGWVAGSEIVGQTVMVQTQGTTNMVYFAPDGTATISTPGGTTVPATWSAANNMLCLSAKGLRECWPYTQPFQAGQQMAMTSDCNQVSTFMAQSTNMPPVQEPMGERG